MGSVAKLEPEAGPTTSPDGCVQTPGGVRPRTPSTARAEQFLMSDSRALNERFQRTAEGAIFFLSVRQEGALDGEPSGPPSSRRPLNKSLLSKNLRLKS